MALSSLIPRRAEFLQPFRLRATAARHRYALEPLPSLDVDHRREGVVVHDRAKSELTQQQPRREQRLRAVVAQVNAVFPQVLANSGDRRTAEPLADRLAHQANLAWVVLDPTLAISSQVERQPRKWSDATSDGTPFRLDRALGGDAAVGLSHPSEQ